MKYPPIPPQQHSPDEAFTNGSTLQSFWQWAYSDLIGNTVRGDIAEYLVASALGITNIPRSSWSRYDLLSPEGISVEVKASGYLQAWGQKKLSTISFQIPKTHGWDNEAGVYESEVKRQSDVYVFCVHNCVDQEKVNPLDVSQWDFYVVPTKVLDEHCGNQKSIALSRLEEIGTVKCGYEELHENIVGVVHPDMEKLEKLLLQVPDTYEDFVKCVLWEVPCRSDGAQLMISFLQSHPKARSDDTLERLEEYGM